VPERTKGYFTSHVSAVQKVLHGYHVEITARSDSDLAPETILQKASDASGARYTDRGPTTSSAPPPVAKKPVFTPTTSSTGSSFNPLIAARNKKQDNVDEDGWGADAPPVYRTQLEKVEPAYKPTKVNLADLTKQPQQSSGGLGGSASRNDDRAGIIGGGYQPVGKVDIAAIRAQAKQTQDDRPTIVKGAYEPVGKVDIAAIRARAQKPEDAPAAPAPTPADDDAPPKSLAERSAAFSQSERLTSLPKPKVANRFGGSSSFTGTKAPTPGSLGFGGSPAGAPAPVTSTSRTFADQGGKTPAQLWAEKKAKQGGAVPSAATSQGPTSPVAAQKSGEWKSGYTGKSWAAVQTPAYGRGAEVSQQKTGESRGSAEPDSGREEPASPGGGVSALRDRFKGAAPMGQAASSSRNVAGFDEEEDRAPPPPPAGSRPAGAFALPGLPSRPVPADEEEQEGQLDEGAYEQEREESPPRIAVPVSRGAQDVPAVEERHLPPPLPTQQIKEDLPKEDELPEDEETHDPRAAAAAVAAQTFDHNDMAESQATIAGGKRALVQYDYEKAEDNELELREGEFVTNIDMVDEDWWMGTNPRGESGLFPSNYVEIVEDEPHAGGKSGGAATAPPPPAPAAEPEEKHDAGGKGGQSATAQFDYEAAEDNGELLPSSLAGQPANDVRRA
jgi:drebrin-like protein